MRSFKQLLSESIVAGKTEPCAIEPSALETLRIEIDRHIGSDTLVEVVETMLAFATSIDLERRSPKCAFSLCELVERDGVLAGLRAFRARRQVERDAPAFAPERVRPPNAAPIKLGSLDFPKKL